MKKPQKKKKPKPRLPIEAVLKLRSHPITTKKGKKACEEPCGRDRRASEIEYLFSVSFPLVGNPSDLFGIARKILDKPE